MRLAPGLLLVVLLTAACAPERKAETEGAAGTTPGTTPAATFTPQNATVQMKNAKGEDVGTLTATTAENGVRFTGTLSNLPPGIHAVHIHETGQCQAPDFKSAGGHYNPAGASHGGPHAARKHAGDLGNFAVPQGGTVEVNIFVPDVSFEGSNTLFPANGTALVVHEGEDDLVSDPAGNAGGRIACGVITRS
jgi:Cu-Zn family superoxide dismutase